MSGKAATAAAAGLCAVLLAGCGGSAAPAAPSSASPGGSGGSGSGSAADTRHTVVKSGFGLSGDGYGWVAALVRNDSDKTGGTVVANFNLLDAGGQIVVSASQTEAFSRPGELLTLGTQVDVPKGRTPVKVDVAVSVEYPGIGPATAFPELQFGPVTVTKDPATGYAASAVLTNPTADALKSPRVGVVCLDGAGTIIGGSSIYPDLVPAHGQTRVKTTSLIVSGRPASCEMRGSPPV
jgi:hypothetical protein